MFKVDKKTSKWRHLRRSGVFIVNFERILYFFSSVSVVDLEHVNVSWVAFSCILRETQVTQTTQL